MNPAIFRVTNSVLCCFYERDLSKTIYDKALIFALKPVHGLLWIFRNKSE